MKFFFFCHNSIYLFCSLKYISDINMCNKLFFLIFVASFLNVSHVYANMKTFWVDRYVSVSYPLKYIQINSCFGYRKDPFTKGLRFHNGIDLESSHDPVLAMFDGYILNIGTNSTSGNYVTLQCGDYSICYCHLSRITVIAGAKVSAGDVIGITGSTGRSTGDHLHISCRYRGSIRNPYSLLEYITTTKEICVRILTAKDSSTDNKEGFIAYYAEAAMEQQYKYGIPASVTLAQMALESAWGHSELARTQNNFFGIKLPGNTYRTFRDVWESIEYHSNILMKNRYAICSQFHEDEYHYWLLGIKACGYAGDVNYVSKCENIIRKYKLYLFDQIALNL